MTKLDNPYWIKLLEEWVGIPLGTFISMNVYRPGQNHLKIAHLRRTYYSKLI